MRVAIALFVPLLLLGQYPTFDPSDEEGLVNHPNGWTRFAWKRKGAWMIPPLSNPFGIRPGHKPATAAEVKTMTGVLDRLTAIIRETPEARDNRGYFVKESRNFAYYESSIALMFESGYFPFYNEDTLRNGVWVTSKGGETESVYFKFNQLPGRYNQRVVGQEPGPNGLTTEFYTRPSLAITYAGFPIVDGEDLMMVRPGRDPWAPIPYARALKAAMVEHEKDRVTAERRLAGLKAKESETLTPGYEKAMQDHLEKYSGELRKTNPNKWQGRVEGMQRELAYNRDRARKDANPQRDAQGNWYWHPVDAFEDAKRRLAALTPEEAAKPACFLPATGEQGRYALPGKILPSVGDPACVPVVTDNYAYFDPKLPRTAPQLLLVRTFGRCAKVVDGKLVGPTPPKTTIVPLQGCYRHVPTWEAMDWSKVAALLTP